ncbi:hypothetical protein LOTGIDRAFT_161618 [Lottia gigantea]|uniref:Fe2OG dioxygenase domain-containing protein n=1 Tax=Lottia gigantea TaxID=225164 RepID=V4AJ19_LOTGI|nr:hypothetical protein LOTGIDRAFT_161618 [Lottia gigantea]ESO93516.1 hypothetical protein LOTGIDRAFT_161618 [Lottia gigantea]
MKNEADADSSGELSYDVGQLKEIQFEADQNFQKADVKRQEILDFGDEGFLLEKLLSQSECDRLIQNGEEKGFDEIRGLNDKYRSSQRIILKNDNLSDILWDRIKDYLKDIVINGDPTEQHIHGLTPLLQGRWKPIGLNNMFRLCRYKAGGHFGPHFDGHYVRSTNERSLQTLMLYLNGDFEGGSTNFIDESQMIHMKDGKYCAEEKNILHQIKPDTGLGIIFNHHRLHEGEKLGNGRKYILRSDIMYKNVDKTILDSKDEQAMLLVQEAERKEASGDCMEAAELYRKAFKLSPTVAEYYGS